MTVRVKICGINSLEAANAALSAGADFAGLVFFERSPRNLNLDQARQLAALLRRRIRVVALLVDPPDSQVDEIVAVIAPDFIQLHGDETPLRVAAIANQAKRPAIKVVAIAGPEDVARARAYEEVADYLLFDAKAGPETQRPGGLGAAFDWQLLAGAQIKRPWGLAGGLTAENVGRAIEIAHPHFVDASSGVEDSPGRKSAAKIAAFIHAARSAQYSRAAS
jgi:phosphoribosylanthranilate isomerase